MALDNTTLAATLQRRSKGYIDVISAQIPLFEHLRKKGQYKSVNGGTQLEWDIEYAQDTTEPSFGGYDTLRVTPQDNVETATATWKNYFKSIAISGEERRVNSGMKIFDLLKQKETNALNSMQQQMNEHFYEDGTANSGKRITGLAAIIAADPTTGTLFGLDRSTRTYWRNQNVDTNGEAFNTATGVFDMLNDMEQLFILCKRQKVGKKNQNKPDLILCTETYYRLYYESVDIRGQRFTNTNKADAGFTNLTFDGVTMIHDEDMPADAGSGAQAYFINSSFMTLNYHPQANFKVTKMIEQEDQDAFSSKVLWMGELTSTNLAKHGLHEGVTAVATS